MPQPPEDGKCEHCGGFYRHEVTHVRDGEVEGAEIQPMKEGEPISAADLLANLEDDETMKKRQTGMTGLIAHHTELIRRGYRATRWEHPEHGTDELLTTGKHKGRWKWSPPPRKPDEPAHGTK